MGLNCERVKDILRNADRKMQWHAVSIVRVGAWFTTCYNNAKFGSRARQARWEIEVQQLPR